MPKNLLLELENWNIEHFITKSYLSAIFECDRQIIEYHVMHKTHKTIGFWNDKSPLYPNLKEKPLSQFELKWFLNNLHKYKIDHESPSGTIWVNKSVLFSMKDKPKSGQYTLFD